MKKFHLLTLGLLMSIGTYSQQDISPLENIQNKINWQTNKDTLENLIQKLEVFNKQKANPFYNYWGAYGYYLMYFISDKKDKERLVENGIKELEAIQTKNSEHMALLSLLEGIALNYANSMTIPFKVGGIEKDARLAIDYNRDNLRAYYALGIFDYFTPKMFGGGKLVEENFLKAIALPDRYDNNPYNPDWGKSEAYLFLVKYYQREGKIPQAKKYVDEALSKYPSHPLLKEQKAKLDKIQ